MGSYGIEQLKRDVRPLRRALERHSIYGRVRTVEDLRTFMERHVFAVWDFMSLLKALQRELTCVSVPWFPGRYGMSRRLINEIVLAEESDLDAAQGCSSHFELYRAAMVECGADVSRIDHFLRLLCAGVPLAGALREAEVPASAARFVRTTWGFITTATPHVIAAAFTFGREEFIPGMFRSLVAELGERFPGRLDLFQYYLQRHIDVDEQSHAPMAFRMVEELCGYDRARWLEARDAVRDALEARAALWGGIASQIESGLKSARVSVSPPEPAWPLAASLVF